MAAGTMTLTETNFGSVKKIVASFTTGTGAEGGTASATTSSAYNGKLIGLTTDPGATAPTDNWDIAVLDGDSHDVLLGAGTDRDTTNTEHVAGSSLGAVAGSRLTFSVTNGGDAKVGVAVLWIQ